MRHVIIQPVVETSYEKTTTTILCLPAGQFLFRLVPVVSMAGKRVVGSQRFALLVMKKEGGVESMHCLNTGARASSSVPVNTLPAL